MTTLLFVGITLFITLFFHAILHRLCKYIHIPIIMSLSVYPVAMFIYFFSSLSACTANNPFIFSKNSLCLPYTSTLLFTLISLVIILSYIFQVAMKSKTPAATIIAYLKQHTQATTEELESICTEKELIDKRIQDLLYSGNISKSGHHYVLTPKGAGIMKFIRIIQTLLHTEIGG